MCISPPDGGIFELTHFGLNSITSRSGACLSFVGYDTMLSIIRFLLSLSITRFHLKTGSRWKCVVSPQDSGFIEFTDLGLSWIPLVLERSCLSFVGCKALSSFRFEILSHLHVLND